MSALSGLSAESRLLLLLARRELTPDAEARCRCLLEGEIAWPTLIALTRTHDVLPLVARRLQTFGTAVVPAEVQAQLAATSRLNAVRNALLAGELGGVLRLLGGAGIPVIPLKGPALAQSLYGDLSARVCWDLDILIPSDAVARAYGLLFGAGYEPGAMGRIAPDEFQLLLESNIEYPFVRRRGGFTHVLEVHWGIAWRWPGQPAAIADLWADRRPFSFDGARAFALSPEWELLYLVVHAARHRWQELKWLTDIHEICRAGSLDWRIVGDKARRFGWEPPLVIALNAAHALLDAPIPAQFRVDRLPGWVPLLPDQPTGPRVSDALSVARLFPGVRAKARYLCSMLLAPTLAERRLCRLPRGLGVLYSLLRPTRLIVKWAWPALRAAGSWLAGRGRARSQVTSRCCALRTRVQRRRAADA